MDINEFKKQWIKVLHNGKPFITVKTRHTIKRIKQIQIYHSKGKNKDYWFTLYSKTDKRVCTINLKNIVEVS